jgi:2-oxoglutarate ferredoxin oxidoreductase subunit gamma
VKIEVVMSGLGGQGVMLISRLLADAGILEGRNVTCFSTYETNIRGGDINCFVILSSESVGSPVVWQPDAVLAMSRSSVSAFSPAIRPAGTLVVNSSLVSETPAREDLSIVRIPAGKMAEKMGEPRVANMILLGAYVKKTGVVPMDNLYRALSRILPERHHAFIPLNREALNRGFEFIH